jgi:adenine phosphoribosyltransferase
LGTGLVPIRKAGELPVPALRQDFVDYTGQTKALELRTEVLRPGTRCLVVDEWAETSTQWEAAAVLIERAGSQVAGLAAINMDAGPRVAALRTRYFCHTVWKAPAA